MITWLTTSFYWIIGLIGLLAISASPAISQKPNILFIMSDDHAAQAIGVYESHLARLNPTPILDQLAHEGILFTNCFVTNSICTPSRACILTGQYSHTSGILDLEDQLDQSKHNLLETKRHYLPIEIRKQGYETAMIGKWHLETEPNFDYYNVLPGQGQYFNPVLISKGAKSWPENSNKYKGYCTDVITDLSIDWIKNRDKNKPFFLMSHYKAPHEPFSYPERYRDYLKNTDIPEPSSLYSRKGWGSEATRGRNDSLINCIGSSVSSRNIYGNLVEDYKVDTTLPKDVQTHLAYQFYLSKYLKCVKAIDDNLKRLFSFLKESGLWENTIIIYTSDQGMMLGAHDFVDKRWMYDESMRMPFILYDPRSNRANKKSDLLINNTDFAPTIIELAGGKVPEYMQGRSFLKEIKGKTPKNWRTGTYYRYWMHLEHLNVPAHFGLRTKNYKLIFFYGKHYDSDMDGTKSIYWKDSSAIIRTTPPAWEFYDMKRDPGELINRYNDVHYQKIIAAMKKELAKQRQDLNDTDEKYPEIKKIIEENWNK